MRQVVTIPLLFHIRFARAWSAPLPLVVCAVSASVAAALPAPLVPQASVNGVPHEQVVEWQLLKPDSASVESGAQLAVASDSSIRLSDLSGDVQIVTLSAHTSLAEVTGLRLEVFAEPGLPSGGPGCSDKGNFVVTEIELTSLINGGRGKAYPLVHAAADFSQTGWSVTGAVDGDPTSGWAILPEVGKDHFAIFETQKSLRIPGGNEFELRLHFEFGSRHFPGRIRLSVSGDPEPARASRLAQVDQELQDKIDAAIAKGVHSLLSAQQLDGSWAGFQDEYVGGQTSLCAYALLKSGVPAQHPALRRAFEYLRTHPPEKTYELGTLMMALDTRGQVEDRPWMEQLCDLMLSWKRSGGYAYPSGEIDISCTQYAALGLRAAARFGVEISERVWGDLAQDALTFQEQTRELEAVRDAGYAGFAYRPGGEITGSRTVAGLTILTIAAEQLSGSKLLTKECREGTQRAVRWLERYFSASSNPRAGSGDRWIYYYLYGVERLGALTSSPYVGGNDWYLEGARYLVGCQNKEGEWKTNNAEPEANTCFALLFLTRATAPSSGRRSARIQGLGGADPEQDLSLRVADGRDLTIWIDSFGDAVRQDYEWPASQGGGLRIAQVEYFLLDQPILQDAREGAQPWRLRRREPREGWTQPDFADTFWEEGTAAFGLEGTPNARVRTVWSEDMVWLRRSFEYDPEQFTQPRLIVNQSDTPALDAPSPTAPLLCLFDEQAGLAGQLRNSSEQARAYEFEDDAAHGRRAIAATPKVIQNPNVPGWSFEVAKKPEPGQYRFLRFSWRKPCGEGGVMLQLARDGSFGDKTIRYHAGDNDVNYTPSVQVAKKTPKKWTQVTCDLYEDFGGGRITGLALTAMNNGEAHFDEIYLARSKKDFSDVPKFEPVMEVVARSASGPLPMADNLRQVFLNGKLVHVGSSTTRGYESVPTSRELEEALLSGTNSVAVFTRATEGGQSFDLGLRGRQRLLHLDGNPSKHLVDERFGVRLPLQRMGTYELMARAQLIAPPEHALAGQAIWFESEPLALELLDRGDALLLTYAADAEQNLLLDARSEVQASSILNDKCSAARAVDGRLTSGWICSDHDTAPAIELKLARALRVNRLVLSHAVADGDQKRSTRAWKVRLTTNDKGVGEVFEMDLHPDRKTVFELGKSRSIRSLRLEILERAEIDLVRGGCGFGEIELQLTRE